MVGKRPNPSKSMDRLPCILLLVILCVSAAGSRTLLPSDNLETRASPADPDGLCSAFVEPLKYPCQEHTVTTQDGFILSLQNIQHGLSGKTERNRPPVLLQHGVLVDAVIWVLNPPSQSLPFILADEGFDVWLVSSRGTKYSRGHTSLSPNDAPYWDWSWDELVAHDLPSTFGYVYNQTGQKLLYIGHSQGTLLALAALSNGELGGLLRSAALLCPIAYISHLTSTLARSVGETILSHTTHWLKIPEFDPIGPDVIHLMLQICKQEGTKKCLKLLKSIAGENCCVNSSVLSAFFQHKPQSTSTKNVIHLAQMMEEGTINKYDYGNKKTNMKYYGTPTPPSYDMTKIPDDIPLFLAHGGVDTISVRKDVKILVDSLSHHQRDRLVVEYEEEYGHADYVMGVNAREVVYDSIIAFFRLW